MADPEPEREIITKFDPSIPFIGLEIALRYTFTGRGRYPPVTITWYRTAEGVRELLTVPVSGGYTPTPRDIGLNLEAVVTWENHSRSFFTATVVDLPLVEHRQMTQFGPPQLEEDSIKVVSYNVLSHGLILKFENEPWFRTLPYRRKRLTDEMEEYKADIMCFQEWDNHFHSWCAPEFGKLGYVGVVKMKTHANDGCGIFYLKERFELLATHEIEYPKLGTEVANKFGSPKEQQVRKLLSKGNVALCLLFKKLDGSCETFCVANTHLNRPDESNLIVLFQMISFVQQVEKFAGNFPVILCGDFNLKPASVAYEFVTKGKLEMEKDERILGGRSIKSFTDLDKEIVKHMKPSPPATSLASAYANFNRSQPDDSRKKFRATDEPWFTIKSHIGPNVYDYIFYSEKSIHHYGVLELPDLRADEIIPSKDWPSDHIALMGQFAFKKTSV